MDIEYRRNLCELYEIHQRMGDMIEGVIDETLRQLLLDIVRVLNEKIEMIKHLSGICERNTWYRN